MQYTREECAALKLLGGGHGENTVGGYFEAWIEVRDKHMDELTWAVKFFLRELPAMQAVLEERREKLKRSA